MNSLSSVLALIVLLALATNTSNSSETSGDQAAVGGACRSTYILIDRRAPAAWRIPPIIQNHQHVSIESHHSLEAIRHSVYVFNKRFPEKVVLHCKSTGLHRKGVVVFLAVCIKIIILK